MFWDLECIGLSVARDYTQAVLMGKENGLFFYVDTVQL
jgi:hypothetical protein